MKSKDRFDLVIHCTVGEYSFVSDKSESFWVRNSSLTEEIEERGDDYDLYQEWCGGAIVHDAPYPDPTTFDIEKIEQAGQTDGETCRREQESEGTYSGERQQGAESPAGDLINCLGWEVIGDDFDLPFYNSETNEIDEDDPETEKVKALFCDLYSEAFDAEYYDD